VRSQGHRVLFCYLLSWRGHFVIVVGARFSRFRVWAFNLAGAILAIRLYDIYVSSRPTAELLHAGLNYTVADPELGYALAPGDRVVASTLWRKDGSVVFDASYGIDARGLRKVAEPASPKDERAVFFFGDAFMFGEGVNDDGTLPSQFAKISGLRALNFGISGQGAHQVLRQLETGRPHVIEAGDPLAIVYLVLPTNHMLRAAGRASWDQNGPRYEMLDGVLQYVGHFPHHEPTIWQKLLSMSGIYSKIVAPKEVTTNSETDRKRLLAIILRCRDLSQTKYHAPFIVILWDNDGGRNGDPQWLLDRLRSEGVQTIDLASAAPELLSGRYQIPGEGHPTVEANKLIARVLDLAIEKFPDGLRSPEVVSHQPVE
jgi:hypothetical protein